MNEVVSKIIEVLRNGGLILYPTDTVWGIGCDPNNEEAVKKLNVLKSRSDGKSLLVVYSKDFVLENYIPEFPEVTYDLIDAASKPLTLILPDARNVAKGVCALDGSLGLRRMSSPDVMVKVLDKLRSGIVSTSANLSGQPTPASYSDISKEIKQGVDYIVPERFALKGSKKPSQIIKLGKSGEVQIIRE